jgi:hypothetical protein
MNKRYALLVLAAWVGCADDQAAEVSPTAALEVPAAALTVQEQSARSSAGQGIDAQPVEVQKRYYQALLMTKKQSASTMQKVVTDLGAQQNAARNARSADSATVGKERNDAQAQLDKSKQRVKELEAKLATF